MALNAQSSENSEYTNQCVQLKDCYLCFCCGMSRDCLYGMWNSKCNECVDCCYVEDCELCFQVLNAKNCYGCSYTENLQQCTNCQFGTI